ncbi:MAG: hypothetical protein MN733_34645, partial [Nitrososphaera sp.]|nr:hypothetical protein [Nitrososphaera sp.]
MTDFFQEEERQESASEMLKNAFTHRDQNIAELYKGIDAAETMMGGLPKVTDALDEFIEIFRTPPRLHELPDETLPPELQQLYVDGTRNHAQDVINKFAMKVMTVLKSIRAV